MTLIKCSIKLTLISNYSIVKVMALSKSVKKKRAAILFKMVSTAGTGYFYLARRNPKQKQEKLEFKKFDPIVRKHVLFKEQKLS